VNVVRTFIVPSARWVRDWLPYIETRHACNPMRARTMAWAFGQSLGTIERGQSHVRATDHVDRHSSRRCLQVFSPRQVVLPEAVARVVAWQTSPLRQAEQFILDFGSKNVPLRNVAFGPLLQASLNKLNAILGPLTGRLLLLIWVYMYNRHFTEKV